MGGSSMNYDDWKANCPDAGSVDDAERPMGWSVCAICGEDCDDESDYSAVTRTSTHRACEDREPPPDGEAFRGGEAAAYERDQMAAWQGLKR